MARFSVSDVVFVQFPFSDLQRYKLRPALVLAETAYTDFVLCQITSQPDTDNLTIEITSNDFEYGSLKKNSYVRTAKLFTANDSIIKKRVGKLKPTVMRKVRTELGKLFQRAGESTTNQP